MLTAMRTRLLWLAVFLTLLNCAPAWGQQPESIGEITGTLDSRALPVAVKSADPAVQRLLAVAFDAHGAYTLAAEDAAQFVITVDPVDTARARVTVVGGRPRTTLLNQEVTGTTANNAVLKAADLAVTKTSGLMGIFAGKIAFIGEREGATELYVGDLFFREARRLTNDRANCVRPAISPDGTTVLYTSYFRSGFPDIYQINLASGRRDSFLSFSGVNTGATYSPDGSRVAVILSGTGNAEVYTVGRDARTMKRLTRNKSIESDPSWSPDGSRVVFASDTGGRSPKLFEVSTAGGAMTRIPTDISNYCAEPAWNPVHANLIAFTIAQAGEFEVALYDRTASKSKTLSTGAGDAVEPNWTRDGRHLIYTERTANHRRLVLLDTQTGHKAYLNDTSFGSASQADYVYAE